MFIERIIKECVSLKPLEENLLSLSKHLGSVQNSEKELLACQIQNQISLFLLAQSVGSNWSNIQLLLLSGLGDLFSSKNRYNLRCVAYWISTFDLQREVLSLPKKTSYNNLVATLITSKESGGLGIKIFDSQVLESGLYDLDTILYIKVESLSIQILFIDINMRISSHNYK